MSGSNGDRSDHSSTSSSNGRKAGTGAKKSAADPCVISEEVPLNSPKANVLAKHKVNDEFQVRLDKAGGRSLLSVVNSSGEVVGSLTYRGYQTLIDCITKGRKYKAVLLRKSGGAVEVRVENAV